MWWVLFRNFHIEIHCQSFDSIRSICLHRVVMSHRMRLSGAKSDLPWNRNETARQERMQKMKKIEEFVVSTANANVSNIQQSTSDRDAIDGMHSVCRGLPDDDSFWKERESCYKRTIDELRFTLAKERLEHNIFLKEMADLLREFDSDADITRSDAAEASSVVMVVICSTLSHWQYLNIDCFVPEYSTASKYSEIHRRPS